MLRRVQDYARVDDVLKEISGRLRQRGEVELVRTREAFGRIAAEDVVSPVDVPSLPASHMDGFAVLAADLRGASDGNAVTLTIRGRGALVGRPESAKHGEAVRVLTGGEMPPGADTVLPFETVEEESGHILVRSQPEPGSHVYQVGEDFQRGETVLSAGRPVRSQDLGMLIQLGLTKVRVKKRPRVSIVATGSELTNSSRPARGKVRNSHSQVILRLCEAQGCDAVDGGVVPDVSGKIAAAIRRSLGASDLVIALGGTSMGRHDLTGRVIEKMRPEVIFHGIMMDRGRVTGVAVIGGKPLLMLPGPIQGAMNGFLLLGVPIIRLLSGRTEPNLEIPCTLNSEWKARRRFPNFRKVLYVRLSHGAEVTAEPVLGETESIKVLTSADGYVSVPEEVARLTRGTRLNVTLIPGFSSA